ncbi:HAD family hydrolase [Corynebacterium sphenisci]|uniref:HAD family hydrolase n=1 Tax=Corynebacterium sphenisci TaxID=191493 RepID=UPI0026DF7654|nr:HAD-IA family hydrolase [Corynebacterium sphenisci]MDO5730887.1 HAD-IA family hydrolase [Corynebacterium sphenisci]
MGPSRRAVLFDLDGVLTPTADYHQAAWGDMFGAFLAARGAAPWTPADYFAHLDGRRRDEGIRALLADRGIELPEGDPAEGPGPDTVAGLGERKNAIFAERIAAGVDPYPGSVAYLDHLAALPEPPAVAVVSSSRNTHAVLAAAGLAERFPVVLDGTRAHALGLAGKPAPDTYLRAAAELGVAPAAATVVEDAVSGVAAGHAGGFGEVIGVDRGAGAAALAAAGADRVVADLAELLR